MASEKERARIMEKARREKYLSPADRAKLTPGQVAKLKSQGHLNDNPTGLRTPESAVGVQNINGQWTVTSVNGKPSFGNPGNLPSPGGSDGGSGGGGGIPAFTTGYTPDSIYNDALAQIAARRQQSLNAATEGERGLSNDYGLGINQDESGAKFTGQWAASDPNQLGIDPSNPFSRASLLNKSYFVAGKVGEGSYANRGLLTSGAYQRSQSRDYFRNEQGRDALIKSFGAQLQDYRQRRAQAAADAKAAEIQAQYDLFARRRDEYDRTYGLNG